MPEGNQVNESDKPGKSDSSSGKADRMDLFGAASAGSSPGGQSTTAIPPQTSRSIYSSKNNRFFSKISRKKILAIAAVTILLIGSGVAFAGMKATNRLQSSSATNDQPSVALAQDVLDQLPQVLAGDIENAGSVSINSPLEVNSTLVVTPSEQPGEARAGQLYFDANTRAFVFYDGTTYQTVSTAQGLGVIQGMMADQQLQNSQEIESRINTGLGIVVAQLQNSQNVDFIELEAGSGIDVTNNRITNTGVNRLQGTANQVVLSGSTGDITVSLPQDIHTGASPIFASLTISGVANLNQLSLDVALDVSSGGTGQDGTGFHENGIVYFDGAKLASTATPTDPFLCLVSTFSAPTFMPCANAVPESVSSLNGVTGDITILNADTNAATKTITPHVASVFNSGIVTTSAQTFAGLKTFSAGVKLGNDEAITADSGITIQPANSDNIVLATAGSGKVVVSNLDCSASGNGGKLTVNSAGEIICAADTGGDGVGLVSVTSADDSIEVDNTDGANPKISVNLQGGGGLSTTSSGIGLIDSCNDNEVLKYNSTLGTWGCAQDADTTDGECSSCVALQTTTPGTPQTGHINIDGTIIAASGSFSGDVTAGGSLNVGGTGVIRTATNNSKAFEVQATEGAAALSVDTTNMNVTVGALGVGVEDLPQTAIFTEAFTGGSFANVQRMVIHDDYSYTLTSSYVVIHDVSVPGKPRHVRDFSLATMGTSALSIAASGNRLYVGSGQCCNYRLLTFDITDRESPDYLSSFNLGHTPDTISVSGNFLYNPNGSNGNFQVVDITNPLLMSWEASPPPSLDSGSYATDSEIKGDYLYYTDNGLNRLVVWNIADPANPYQVTTVSTNSGPRALQIVGDHVFVVNDLAGTLQIFNISNPASPTLLSTTTTIGLPYELDIVGSRLLVVGYTANRLQMIDISDLESPTAFPVTSPTFAAPVDVEVDQGYAYVVSRTNGRLEVFALGNRDALTVNGNSLIEGTLTAHSGTFAGTITANNVGGNDIVARDTVYTPSIDTEGSVALEIGSTNATSVNINQNTTFGAGKTVMVQGDTTIQHNSVSAFSVNDSELANLFNIDTSTKNISIGVVGLGGGSFGGGGGSGGSFDAPTTVTGSSSTSMLPWDISVTDEYAYVSNLAMNTLEVFDIGDSASPTSVGSLSIGGATYVHSDGSLAVMSVSNLMRIADVSDPTAPVARGTYTPNGGGVIWDLYVKGNYAFIVYKATNGSSYVESIDISDPDNPAFISRTTMGTGAIALHAAMDGDFIYVAMQGDIPPFSSLRTFNISNPSSISVINRALSVGNGQDPRAIAAKDSIVWVAFNDTKKIVAFDYTVPSSSTQHGSITTSTTIVDMAVSPAGPYLLALDNSQQLFTYDATDIDNMSLMTTTATVAGSTTQSHAVTANSHAIYVINRSGSENLVAFSTGTPTTGGSGSGPTIFFNQNTLIHEGATFTSEGDVTVKTDSAAAFQVQTAAGVSVLSVDTTTGIVDMAQLNVSGASTLDSLVVTNALSVGTTLVVSGDATFNGSIIINGHVATGGTAPTSSVLAGLGTGASCTVSGNDTSGTITLVAGDGAAPAAVCDVIFAAAFAQAPRPVVSSAGQSGASMGVYVDSSATNKFTVALTGTAVSGEVYVFNYWNAQ